MRKPPQPGSARAAASVVQLNGRRVVVTGAASGIGAALAHALAARGARLVLADIDTARLQAVCAALTAGQASAHALDVADAAAVDALAQEVAAQGGADVLINNAGVSLASSIEGMTLPDAHWLMNINFWGVVHGCRAFLPQLRARAQARIVNVSSIFAMVSLPANGMYAASKAAVRGLSDVLRLELAGSGVGVLCVHPGGIRTRIAAQARIGDISLLEVDADELRRNFDQRLARTSAADAALSIVRAIEQDRSRLLIGGDARLADLLYRLAPQRASAWVAAKARRQRGKD